MSQKSLSPKTIFLIVFGVIVLFVAILYVNRYLTGSKAALGADGVKITFTPASGTIAPNTDTVINVKLAPVTATNSITGFDLRFSATGNLQFVSATKATGFGDELFHTVNPTSMRIARTVGSTGAAVPIAEFSVTVRGTGTGSGTMTIDSTNSEVVGTLSTISFGLEPTSATYDFGTGGGPTATTGPQATATTQPQATATTQPQATATTVPNATATTQPQATATTQPQATATQTPGGGGGPNVSMTLNIKIKFQGITTKPANSGADTVKVSLKHSTFLANPVVASGSFTPDANGIYSGSVTLNAPAGSGYSIFIKGPRHLQKKICVAAPTETSPGTYRCSLGQITLAAGVNTFDFSKIIQLVGDLPQQDGIVDSYDTSYIRQNFGTTDPNKLAIGDLNRDNIIDTQDMSLIIQSLNVKYDEE